MGVRPGLVDVGWLASRLGDPGIQIVDASWYSKLDAIDPRAEFVKRHIPGAVFFDIDQVASWIGELPHMLPTPMHFADAVGKLGIGNDTHVIVYDQKGIASAACRFWWELRVFGHGKVDVLDGGLPAWISAGQALSDAQSSPPEKRFTSRYDASLVRGLSDVKTLIRTYAEHLIDARSAERWAGEAEEPWGEPGRVPGSINLPYDSLLDAATGRMLPEEDLRERFSRAKVELDVPITLSCGSGVTACVLALALFQLGCRDAAVYDGSWAEWNRTEGTVRERGRR